MREQVNTDNFTILVVQAIKPSVLSSVRKLQDQYPQLGRPHVVLATTDPHKYSHYASSDVVVVECDFTDVAIRKLLNEVEYPVKAVLCRGDGYIQYLRAVAPLLPKGTLVASAESLAAATDKYLMREAFLRDCPEITPQFMQVEAPSMVQEIADKLTFPVIIKPTNLASSLLIQRCDTKGDLEVALTATFQKITEVYSREGRHEQPNVIVEEYLEGDFYSIDSYVTSTGRFFHLPLVYYVAAKQLGIDDFFLYKRTTPTDLTDAEVHLAEVAAEKAMTAVGLQYSSAHIEMIRTRNGDWKIIELGPRLGRFRNTMYREAYAIDHSYNDLLVHFGIEPILTRTCMKYCAAYSIYPEHEGILEAITNIDKLQSQINGLTYTSDSKSSGNEVFHARNGGHALYELVFSSETRESFEQDCAWIEENIHPKMRG